MNLVIFLVVFVCAVFDYGEANPCSGNFPEAMCCTHQGEHELLCEPPSGDIGPSNFASTCTQMGGEPFCCNFHEKTCTPFSGIHERLFFMKM